MSHLNFFKYKNPISFAFEKEVCEQSESFVPEMHAWMHSVFPSEKEQKARRIGCKASTPSVIQFQTYKTVPLKWTKLQIHKDCGQSTKMAVSSICRMRR